MASPRLASRAPRACAACYGQYTDRAHVDFMAGYEGGLIDPSQPRAGHVDWLVICEKCLRTAVALLPEDPATVAQIESRANDIAAQRTAALREQLTQAQAYADSLEDAFQRRPAERAERAPKAQSKPAAKGGRKPRYSPQEEA